MRDLTMPGNPAIVLIGFMGAGKSWAAAAIDGLAGRAQDIDELIEAQTGMSVRDFFDSEGEDAFREVESDVAVRLLREADGGVLALGGGTVLSPDVQSELKRHVVVWLDVAADTAWDRVSESDRPLVARGRPKFDALLAERRPIYAGLANAVLPEGDPNMILRALPSIQALTDLPGAKMLWARSASGEYPVFVGMDLLKSEWWPLAGRRFCVTDSAVGPLYTGHLAPLEATVEVPPGEGAKTMAEAERVLSGLARAGMTREDHVVALGGGVVGDLAGFCAHAYQRGVAVVQAPTTLVAQVDSAYGGKTGVDLPEGKNYAGAYHLPAAVIADTGTLASLPREELAAGFVEALKTGLLAGGELWEQVRAIEALDPAELDDVVFACARHKCAVVAADERDAGLRHSLNLGHTVGHAIEAASGYARYRHGEAIGLGLLAALRLSEAEALRAEIAAALARHGLPVELDPAIGAAEILAALQRDKKRTAAGVGFVLLAEPGAPRVGQLVDAAKVEAAVKELYAR
jgi:shikimate kinase/3-dehydroquinate synthase